MKFNQPYDSDNFRNFLDNFLPEDLVFKLQDLVIDDKYKIIKSGKVLGECESLGIKILELKHDKEKDPRVSLANEAFKLMADNWIKRALVVFKSINSHNWRFSYMTISFEINEKNKIAQNLSNPKRKSFYLGPDAKILTPNNFLNKKGRVVSIADLESRFDVEVVTNEFFDNYKKLFNRLTTCLNRDKTFDIFANKNQIKIEDFAKKLLGQIVFIYFLQRKGWLGAKKESHINEGDLSFLRNLYTNCEFNNKNFFNDVLEQLFYNALNKESEKSGNFYREYFDCQIPFLNGGLFEPLNKYDWENSFLNIPNDIFSNETKTGILDIFDLYNFTIDENNTIDQEVSVDPEMLGKVFEKLLETNKETGSFYTPREIVSYMVKQSLIEYLIIKTDIDKDNIEELINNHRINDVNFKNEEYREINNALKEIKIIDPAVGSGAFPVGALQEITGIRLICENKISNNQKSAYSIKKEILENNIYGVDIDHGAIDIARLRFWLSLVVEADLNDVEPLPNLDFKLVAANSLLKLNKDEGPWDEKDLLNQMKELREKYFRARTRNGKEKIQNDFNKIIRKSNTLLATDRQRQLATYNPFSPSIVANFFDSDFMFGVKEFDMVIGNPPYISAVTMKNSNEIKNIFKRSYPLATGAYDMYILFLLLGISLLSEDGIYAWIIPNKFLIADYAKLTKNFLLENGLKFSIDVSTFNVFKSAGVYPNIIIGVKGSDKAFKELALGKYTDLDEKKFTIFNKIKKFKTFKDFGFKIYSGTTGFQAQLIKKYIKNYHENNSIPFIVSGSVDKYYFNNKNVRYMGDWYKEAYIENNKDIAVSKWDFWTKEKIIIAGMTKEIEAAYSQNPVALGVGIYGISDTACFNKKFILSILNSKYLSYFLKNNFKDKHLAGGYLAINKSTIEELPLVNLSMGEQEPFVKLVDKILEITSDNNYNSKKNTADVVTLQKEIDSLVYKAYGLTSEEIENVEKS